jgi:hypothetical protein
VRSPNGALRARGAAWPLGALLALAASPPAAATVRLDVEARAGAPEAPSVAIRAVNIGDEPAIGVAPEVTYQHAGWRGEPVRLEPGTSHEWRFALPPPAEPGTAVVFAHVHFTDPAGRTATAPAVTALATPDAPPREVAARLTGGTLGRVGSVSLTLDNHTGRRAAGRVALVLPDSLRAEPASQAAEVAPGATTTFPLMLDTSRARPGVAQTVYAVFEYADAGAQHAVVARANVERAAHGGRGPLAVGGFAVVTVIGVLVLALRRSARRA